MLTVIFAFSSLNLLYFYLIDFFFSDVVLYAASANRQYVDNIIKVLADVVLRPRITDDEVTKKKLLFNLKYKCLKWLKNICCKFVLIFL